MDTTISQSALDALRTAEFRLSLRGYDVDEVDDFLERAAVEADGLREQLRQLNTMLNQANERVRALETGREDVATPAPATEVTTTAPTSGQTVDSVTKMLEIAERFVAQTRKEAEDEASALLADARDRARQLATDAQQGLADEVARLEGLRQRLGEDVEKLSRRVESERARIAGNLHELLAWLDQHLQPAAVMEGSHSGGNGDTTALRVTNGESEGGGAQVLLLDDARGDGPDAE